MHLALSFSCKGRDTKNRFKNGTTTHRQQSQEGALCSQESHSIRDHRRVLEVKVGVHTEGCLLPTLRHCLVPCLVTHLHMQPKCDHMVWLILLFSCKAQHDKMPLGQGFSNFYVYLGILLKC